MKTSALWFGIVAIALAAAPAHAQRKVDWSQYIDPRAVANANAPADSAGARGSDVEPAPDQATNRTSRKASKSTKTASSTTKATKGKAKARAAKKARRK